MGRQRRRKQRSDLQGPRVDSFLYDEAGLLILAYLERTIIYSMRLEFFGPDVIFHYKEQLQRDISVAEIDAKLCLFWSHWHSVDDKPVEWRKIYKLGLKGLPLLEDEWKEWVRKKAAMLKDVTEGTPRRLRSRSALPRSLRNPAKRPLSSPIGDPSGSQVQNIQNHSESPAQRKRTRMSISAQNARRTPNSPTSERGLSKRKLQEGTRQHYDDATDIKSEVVSSSRSSPSEQLCYSIGQSRLSQLISELDDLRAEKSQVMSMLEKATDQKAQLMLELDNLRDQKAEDTQYWERLYQKTQKRRNALKRRNKHMQAEYSIGQSEISKMNLNIRLENDNLIEKLDSYKAIFQFTEERFVEGFQAQNLRNVVGHIDLVLLKLYKVLQGQDALFSIKKLVNIEGIDILALFERGFGLDFSVDSSSGSTISTIEICGTKIRSVVLGLVSAALCTWVFEAEVGALFQESNLVYSKLQSLLAAQDKKLMNGFEFASHERCITDPFFCNVMIPRRAKHLAERILNCVKPLLEAHRSLNEDYAVIADEWLEANHQITEIFKQALHAKVRLLLSTDMYKCALYVPSTPFDSNIMQRRTEGFAYDTKNEPGCVVDVTIFPGLIRYALNDEDFNYNRFLTREAVPTKMKAEVMRRAEVLTQ